MHGRSQMLGEEYALEYLPLFDEELAAAVRYIAASPVYFYSISAQLKALIDRTVVVYPNLTNKKFYFLLTMADTNRKMFDASKVRLQENARRMDVFRASRQRRSHLLDHGGRQWSGHGEYR